MLIGAIDCRNDPIGNDWQLDIVKPQTPSFSLNPPLLLPGDWRPEDEGRAKLPFSQLHAFTTLFAFFG